MSEDTNDTKTVNNVNVKIPEFIIQDPRLWFAQLEIYFRCRRTKGQDNMFDIVATNIPPAVVCEVSELIYNPPKDNPYDAIKSMIIKRLASSEDQNLRKLLAGIELGDRTPSQLLRHMSSMTSEATNNETLIRELWLQALPRHLCTPLSVVDKDTPLTKLAELADQVHESCNSRVISQVQSTPPDLLQELTAIRDQYQKLSLQVATLTRSRSNVRNNVKGRQRSPSLRSKSNEHDGLCWYHRRYGVNARRCTIPCSFHQINDSGNARSNQ
jgi:hypothetical protein